ncbi:MAG: hypothetical protein ACAH88_04255 [Roseimicrobium sp.]
MKIPSLLLGKIVPPLGLGDALGSAGGDGCGVRLAELAWVGDAAAFVVVAPRGTSSTRIPRVIALVPDMKTGAGAASGSMCSPAF